MEDLGRLSVEEFRNATKFPVVIVLGGALLGYIAGDMIARDFVYAEWMKANFNWVIQYHVAGIVGALVVVAAGKLIGKFAQARKLVDLAAPSDQTKP